MRKKNKRVLTILIGMLLVMISLAATALAAPSDYTISVRADAEDVKRGDVLTVKVSVSGAQFCAVDAEMSYDTERLEYVSSMSGWSDDGEGRLRYINVKGSDGYWDDGKVIGTFRFAVKKKAPAGEAVFAIGESREAFIVGDWAEGASSEPAKALAAEQLVGTSVRVEKKKSDSEPLTDFGAISDDGYTVNMDPGNHVYVIPDADNEQVVWESDDESIVTVDNDGLVTAVSEGSAMLTAVDKAGNVVEQRMIVVGEMPEEEVTEEAAEAEPAESEKNEKTKSKKLWIWIVAVIVLALCAGYIVLYLKKQKLNEE